MPAPAETIKLSYGRVDRGTVGPARLHLAAFEIEAGDLGQQHRGVLLKAQDVPQRRGDLPLGEDAGRDLVEQRLEQVVGLAVDEGDVDRRPAERARREEPTEAAAHDQHPVAALGPLPVDRHATLQLAALVEHEQQRQRRHGGDSRRSRNVATNQPSVRGAPAAASSVSEVGSRYGYCATPHPASMLTTATTASARVPRVIPWVSRTMTAPPQAPEISTKGSPSRTRPWNRNGASLRRTNSPHDGEEAGRQRRCRPPATGRSGRASRRARRASNTRNTAARNAALDTARTPTRIDVGPQPARDAPADRPPGRRRAPAPKRWRRRPRPGRTASRPTTARTRRRTGGVRSARASPRETRTRTRAARCRRRPGPAAGRAST